MVMEFCSGGSLDRYLNQRLAHEHSQKLIWNAANGLAYLHGQSITHRDLKPGNILLTSKNLDEAEAKLCGKYPIYIRFDILNFNLFFFRFWIFAIV